MSGPLSIGDINRAASAYADATGYYLGAGQLHPGLSSPSADKVREGVRAALDAVKFPELKAAALRLYMRGNWTCGGEGEEEAKLWDALRDALMLRPGTATAAGVGSTARAEPKSRMFYLGAEGDPENVRGGEIVDRIPAHGCPACDDAMECSCEPPLPMFGAE